MARHNEIQIIEIEAQGWGNLTLTIYRYGDRVRTYYAHGKRRISVASVQRAQRAQLRLAKLAPGGAKG